MSINVRRLTESEFAAMEKPWQKLLKNSDADPLFLSWPWQFLWWKTWNEKLGLELLLLGVFEGERLIGLAPLYINKFKIGPLKHFKRLQFIGNAWRLSDTVRTEYLSFISERSKYSKTLPAIFSYLKQHAHWDEWVFSDIDLRTRMFSQYLSLAHSNNLQLRHLGSDFGVLIHCKHAFSQYLKQLGKNIRTRAFNSRKKLSEQGQLEFNTIACSSELKNAFAQLNTLHSQRWSSQCFNNEALEFHYKLSLKMLEADQLKFSTIKFQQQAVSALYNIRINGKEYNLQAGYKEQILKGISLGSMHLGFAIESAFQDPSTYSFDLLAGEGMNSNYKKKYNGERVHFKSFHLIRHPLLKVLYFTYDRSPLWLKSWLYGRRGFG